ACRRSRGQAVRQQNRGERCRPGDAAAFQATAQSIPCLLQPPPERALAPSQLARRFFLRPALQVAQDERQTPLVWQLSQFGIGGCEQLFRAEVVRPRDFRYARPLLVTAATGCSCLGLQSHPVSNAVQPTCQGIVLANGPQLLGEQKEGSLKGVLGVLGLLQN